MVKLGKVIAGLRNCSYPSENCYYSDCPYCGRRDADKVCMDFLMEDALDVIVRLREENQDLRREVAAGVLQGMPNDWGEYPPEFPREGM